MRRALALASLLTTCVGTTVATPAPPAPVQTSTPVASATAPLAWRRIADIPTPRSEVAAVQNGASVVVIGGFGGGNSVEIYLPQEDRWVRTGRGLPLSLDHAMAASVPGSGAEASHVYLIGGNVNGVASARAFRGTSGAAGGMVFDEVAPMPAPRSQGASATVGTKIYVVGGARDGRLVGPTYVYDTAVDTWATVAAIPTSRDHLAAVTLGDRVCAIGGRKLSLVHNLATFECYDPAIDTWRSLPDAPTARGGIGAAVVGNRVFVVGGEEPLGTFKKVDIYDATTATWSRGPDLPTPRHGLGVVAVGGTVYVMSGGPTPGASQTPVCEALDVR